MLMFVYAVGKKKEKVSSAFLIVTLSPSAHLPHLYLVDICHTCHSFLDEIVGLFFGFYFDIKQTNRDCIQL